MSSLNHFVFEDGDRLINITNKKSLPKNSSDEELKENFFFLGQEQDCIDSFLFRRPKSFEIKLITTWTCNMRCSHCFVLDQLVKKDSGSIEIDKLRVFLESYLDEFRTPKGRIHFVGGESALTAKFNLEVMDMALEVGEKRGVKMIFHSNTNGFELNEDIIRFYDKLDNFTISLDGPKHLHDTQRKALNYKGSPFEKTVSNIRRLVELGMREKIVVQASVSDEAMNEECISSFYKTLLMSGVKFENIIYGVSVPTPHHNPGQRYKQARRRPFPIPCCKYRWMGDFTVCSDNNIYCDYFDATGTNKLGSLTDSISSIADKHGEIIRQMPIFSDSKCMGCPVVGLCWGNCCNLHKMWKPSEVCDAEGLYNETKKASSEGRLVKFIRGVG